MNLPHGVPYFILTAAAVLFAVVLLFLFRRRDRSTETRLERMIGFAARSGFEVVPASAALRAYARDRAAAPEAAPPAEPLDARVTTLKFPREIGLYGSRAVPLFESVLKRRIGDADFFVMDYSYILPAGSKTSRFDHTLCHVRSQALSLPAFSMRPEQPSHQIMALLDFQDIDFPTHQTFSDRFLLRGPDPGAIRRLFTPPILGHLEEASDMILEGYGEVLVAGSPWGFLRGEDLEAFVKEIAGVYGIFHP